MALPSFQLVICTPKYVSLERNLQLNFQLIDWGPCKWFCLLRWVLVFHLSELKPFSLGVKTLLNLQGVLKAVTGNAKF